MTVPHVWAPRSDGVTFSSVRTSRLALLGFTHSNQGDQVFTSIRKHREEESADTSDRLRFVSEWFRTLGVVLVGLWILAGLAFVAGGVKTRQTAAGLIFGVGGATLGILLTAPVYFWFSAIASGLASLVDHAKERKQ